MELKTSFSSTIAKLQHGRGAALDAQLVLDAHAMHVIALAQAAVGVHQELGHDEQRIKQIKEAADTGNQFTNISILNLHARIFQFFVF